MATTVTTLGAGALGLVATVLPGGGGFGTVFPEGAGTGMIVPGVPVGGPAGDRSGDVAMEGGA